MNNSEFYREIIDSIIHAAPSALMLIDRDGIVKESYITKRKKASSLIGKDFKHILRILLNTEVADVIYRTYLEARTFKRKIELPSLALTNCHGLDEYVHLHCIPIADNILVYAINVTEMILMEQEFYDTTEHYEALNHELNVAMSKLDLYLMDIEQAHKKVSALYRVTSSVQKKGSPDEILLNLLEGITREFGFVHVKILFVDYERRVLKVKAYKGKTIKIEEIPLGKGIIGYAAQQREVVYVPNVNTDDRYIPNIEGIFSELAIPLIVDNEVIGILDVQTSEENPIQKYDLDMLMSLASQIAVTVAHVIYVANVEHQAVTDGLTGLYNYRYFYNRLQQEYKRAARYNRPLSLLMLDIDYFKSYNDTYGHTMGDVILKKISTIIKNNVRDVDTVVRYGGEEFAVILPETYFQEAYTIAERIRSAVEKCMVKIEDNSKQTGLTVSIGVADSCSAESYLELIKCADSALYEAKNTTRNCVCIYKE